MKGYTFPPALLNTEQAAWYCGGMGRATFNREIAPHLPAVTIGTRKYYPRNALEDFIAHSVGLPVRASNENNPLDELLKK